MVPIWEYKGLQVGMSLFYKNELAQIVNINRLTLREIVKKPGAEGVVQISFYKSKESLVIPYSEALKGRMEWYESIQKL